MHGWMKVGQSTGDLPAATQGPAGRGDSADGLTLCCVPHSLVPAEVPCPPGREEEPDDGQHETPGRGAEGLGARHHSGGFSSRVFVFMSVGTPRL